MHKNGSFEDINPSFSHYPPGPQDFRRQMLNSTPSSASRTLQYSFNSPQSRELPPTPGEGNSGRRRDSNSDNRLNPSERLDRLMASGMPSNSSSPNTSISLDRSVNSGRDSMDRSSVQSGNFSDKPPQPRTYASSQGGRAYQRAQNQNQPPMWGKSPSPMNSQRPQQSVSPNGPNVDSTINSDRIVNNIALGDWVCMIPTPHNKIYTQVLMT